MSRFTLIYLIHWPGALKTLENSSENPKLRCESWKTLVELKKVGKLRLVGVSNYLIRHLAELLQVSKGKVTDVNQVECHPHFIQDELI